MIEQPSARLRSLLDAPVARWLAVAAWMTLIFILSAQPRLPRLGEQDVLFKKAGHFLEYGILALLIWRAMGWGRRAVGAAWALALLYACSDEWHQSFVPGRHARLTDVLIDACGAAVLLLFWMIVRLRGDNVT